ncbi:glycosyltransferase [Coprobacter tertius]|uniref:Glycosyltransferase n=1 Tax=Coprobacter tertius TaxID=2944915 RepID=A0ABT1ME81_9BACT|nr:glycosyltransferase [Coprobacter tertius]MCP9610939.1 glycosyltransferase [Coprobacter tertius]
MPEVSVIIPLYNTAEFVEEAVMSVMNQTFKDVEIIIVNDGSTDNSLQIVEKMALKDDRICVYTQQNQGPAITRNVGLQKVKGKYIYFMDSDDYLEPETLSACYAKCEENLLDFIFFDADILNKEVSEQFGLNYQRKSCTDENKIYKGVDILNILLDNKGFAVPIWLNFIRADYLRKKNLRFYPGLIHDDALFSFLLYIQAERVMCIHEDFFKRRFRENSIMTTRFSRRNMDNYFIIAEELIQFAQEYPSSCETVDKYLSGMMNAAVWLAYRIPLKDRLYVAKIIFGQYKKYVSNRNLLILLFKSFIKK